MQTQVVALVLDAVRCVGDDTSRFIVPVQDYRLAELIAAEGRAAVIVVNKWDAVTKDAHTLAEYEKELLAQLRPLSWAPVVFTSAFSGTVPLYICADRDICVGGDNHILARASAGELALRYLRRDCLCCGEELLGPTQVRMCQ